MKLIEWLKSLGTHRKETFVVAAVWLGLAWIFGDDIAHLAKRIQDHLRGAVRDSVRIELELERARRSVASLVPNLRQNHEILVREQVEIEDLRSEMTKYRAGVERDQKILLNLRNELDAKKLSCSPIRQEALRRELATRFMTFQFSEATLNAKLEGIRRREVDLSLAKEKQAELLESKRQLDAEVANLEARLELLRAQPLSDRVHVNDQKLTESFELIRYVRNRLAVAERLAESNARVDESELEFPVRNVEAEIDRYFAERQTSAKAHP